jgi:ATP-dependent DNA helicase DinG
MVDVVPRDKACVSWRVNRGHVLTLVEANLDRFVDVPLLEYQAWPQEKKERYPLFRALSDCENIGVIARVDNVNVLQLNWFDLVETGTVEPYYGFTLDEDGRFLLEDLTVVHNTGKSLAYAVPATYYAATEKKTIVIATANIALQEQLVDKDLPFLRSVLPWGFTFALMKGRNHHLCREKLEDYETRTASLFKGGRDHHGENVEERRQLPIVYEWAHATATAPAGTETGDVSELPFVPLDSVWRQFSVSADGCKGQRCKNRRECFPSIAHRKARESQVVVTNYHMVCANVSTYMSEGVDRVLPPFDVFIGDEIHKMGDIARDSFGSKITLEGARRIGKPLQEEAPSIIEAYDRACAMFFAVMGQMKHDEKRYKARIASAFTKSELEVWETLRVSLVAIVERYAVNVPNLIAVYESAIAQLGVHHSHTRRAQKNLGDQEKAQGRAETILDSLTRAMNPPQPGDREVFFIDEDEKRGNRITIASRLLYPSDFLRPGIFEHVTRVMGDDDIVEHKTTVVATSATLATDGNFKYAATELGVPAGYTELIAESPFDWANQCLFVIPDGPPGHKDRMPAPNDPAFADAVAVMTERICRIAKGRTLGLFTSRRVLQIAYDHLVSTIGRTYTILKQGDAPKMKLIERFKSDTSSILLGNDSFWAGVDVPGEALSCVIIDKLPFASPNDPVMDALSANDKSWFFKYSIPRSIIEFKQGAGRGVRSVTDKCAIVCLDRRILDKKYGKQFLRALPAEVPKSTRLEAIGEFLGTLDPFEEIEPETPMGETGMLPWDTAANDDSIPF